MLYEPDALVFIELQAKGGEIAVAEESRLGTAIDKSAVSELKILCRLTHFRIWARVSHTTPLPHSQ